SPVAALPDTAAAVAVTPGRSFLLLAPALAFGGILLLLGFKIEMARRRRVYVDPPRLNRPGTIAREPAAPRPGDTVAPPCVPEDSTEALNYDETLRQILRTLERGPPEQKGTRPSAWTPCATRTQNGVRCQPYFVEFRRSAGCACDCRPRSHGQAT